jgi:Cu-Zn family superoxide dismutase
VFDADGSAVVIHGRGDDYRSDPAGEAGNRIACGVIH